MPLCGGSEVTVLFDGLSDPGGDTSQQEGRMNRLAALLGVALMAAACGGDQPRATTPTAPSIITSPARQTLFGSVSDTAFGPLVGARVEIVDGPQAGAFLTTAQDGRFSISFSSSETVTVRATKGGYVPATMSVRPPSGVFLSFYLSPVAPPVNMAGTYTLTFVADSSCTQIPDDLRTRTYTATMTPSPYRSDHTLFDVTLSGASFYAGTNIGNYNSFDVGVAGDVVALSVYNGLDEGEGIVEQLGPTTYLEFAGSASGSVGASDVSTISVPFDGRFQYCVAKFAQSSLYRCYFNAATLAECRSKNHRLILTRR